MNTATVTSTLVSVKETVINATTIHVSPNTNFPGSAQVLKLIDVGLGVMLFGSFGLFFWGLFRIAASFAGKRQGGAGLGAIGALFAAFFAAVIITGGAYLNGWIKLFGG